MVDNTALNSTLFRALHDYLKSTQRFNNTRTYFSILFGNLNIFISLYAIPNFSNVGETGLLFRTCGPNDKVNIDMDYLIIVIHFHQCGQTKSNRRISDN